MGWGTFGFLAESWFVVPWYAVGMAGAIWVGIDLAFVNTAVNKALKPIWPIITLFFSVIGLLLYRAASRPPGIGDATDPEEKARAFEDYVSHPFRKVIGSVLHCVGGDGLGIVTAMALARLAGLSFWQEYWFEYAVGYCFGWFIFQYIAFRAMGDSRAMSIWKGGRAEFFSMITVMLGMGLVMRLVTPRVVGAQPTPSTYAFWGFSALGLLAGFVLTMPTNWWLVRIGWKHGQG